MYDLSAKVWMVELLKALIPQGVTKMNEQIRKLKVANMDIDVATQQGSVAWEQDNCPWNEAEGTNVLKCALKNVSICPYFFGVEYLDTLLRRYPNENALRRNS
jgi:hypothetical protein